MHENRALTDSEILNGAAHLGDLRCRAEDEAGGAILTAGTPLWQRQRAALLVRQLKALGGANSTVSHYMEVLAKAQELVEFMRHNVGETADWPIMLMTDAEVTAAALEDRMRRLETAMGVLLEV